MESSDATSRLLTTISDLRIDQRSPMFTITSTQTPVNCVKLNPKSTVLRPSGPHERALAQPFCELFPIYEGA